MKKQSIKGLIVKDLLNLSHYKRTLLFVIIIFIGTGFSSQNTLNYLPIMLMAMIGMIGLSTFSYDEISKADKYLLTLPTSKKELVKARYLLVIAMILVGAVIAFVAVIGIDYIVYKGTIEIFELISMLIGGIFGISVIEAIQIPSIYKWGAEKGRIQMFVLVIIVAALIGGVIFLANQIGFQFDNEIIITMVENFGVVLLLIFTVIMYVVSYRISCKVFSKKDL